VDPRAVLGVINISFNCISYIGWNERTVVIDALRRMWKETGIS